jgi:hypothetical protein
MNLDSINPNHNRLLIISSSAVTANWTAATRVTNSNAAVR